MSASVNPNTTILADCYSQWHATKGGNIDQWLEIMDDAIDFRSLAMGRDASGAFTAPCNCKNDVRGYFEGLTNDWSMVHYTVDRFIADGDDVAMVGSTAWTNKRTGKTVETPKVDVWKFKDGKAVSFYEYYDTAALFAGATA